MSRRQRRLPDAAGLAEGLACRSSEFPERDGRASEVPGSSGRARPAREEEGLHDIVHVVDVAYQVGIPQNRDRRPGERLSEERAGEAGARPVQRLPRSVGIREPQHRESAAGEHPQQVLGRLLVDRMDVRGLDGVVLVRGLALAGAVDLAGAREDDARPRSERGGDGERGCHVVLEIRQGMLLAGGVAIAGGEVEDDVRLSKPPGHGRREVRQIAAVEDCVGGGFVERPTVDPGGVRAGGGEAVEEPPADESGGAGHHDLEPPERAGGGVPIGGRDRGEGSGHGSERTGAGGRLAARKWRTLPAVDRDPDSRGAGPGTLFVVATPIGNLEDLSPRAARVLGGVGWIACEDTRVTGRLKGRFGLTARLVSLHEHNEWERVPGLLRRLESGEDLALVTDAGTPLVSDPGYRLVRGARKAALPVRVVPGPSAVAAALSVSGLPTDTFTFLGFPPARRGARRGRFVARAAEAQGSIVLFESGRRVAALLAELADRLGPRDASVSREMTKLHEEHWFGTLPELRDRALRTPPRGEVTLVVAPAGRRANTGDRPT